MTKVIFTDKAPLPQSSYSQGVVAGDLYFSPGLISIDPVTQEMKLGSIEEEITTIMKNLGAYLEAAGSGYDKIVKANLTLTDIKDSPVVNKVYAEYIKENLPGRMIVQVDAMPAGAHVCLEVVAYCGE